MRRWRAGWIGFVACLALLAAGPVFAAEHGDRDRVAFGETINVDEGQTVGDIVCAFCTVRVRGDVSGDMVTFFGTTEVADGKAISGDVVAFGGGLKLGEEARIGSDLVFFGGELKEASSAVIHGDRVVFAGSGWLLILLIPLLIPIGLVWLVVHLIRRATYRFLAYPGGRY